MANSKAGLFVYGTLHPERAPDEIKDVVRQLKWIGTASIQGTIYNLGEYPGLVLKGNKRVNGMLFALPDDPEALEKLDAYEEFQPENPKDSLFIREKRFVTLASGERQLHWVYLYNRQVNGLPASSPNSGVAA